MASSAGTATVALSALTPTPAPAAAAAARVIPPGAENDPIGNIFGDSYFRKVTGAASCLPRAAGDWFGSRGARAERIGPNGLPALQIRVKPSSSSQLGLIDRFLWQRVFINGQWMVININSLGKRLHITSQQAWTLASNGAKLQEAISNAGTAAILQGRVARIMAASPLATEDMARKTVAAFERHRLIIQQQLQDPKVPSVTIPQQHLQDPIDPSVTIPVTSGMVVVSRRGDVLVGGPHLPAGSQKIPIIFTPLSPGAPPIVRLNIKKDYEAACRLEYETSRELRAVPCLGQFSSYEESTVEIDNDGNVRLVDALVLSAPYYSEGDLFERLTDKNRPPMTWGNRVLGAGQLIRALMEMHKRDIAHRDIKAENIFLGKGGFNLSDLGMALKVSGRSSLRGGTIQCMPPEFFRVDPCDLYKADVWSLGLLLVDVFFGQDTFFKHFEIVGSTDAEVGIKAAKKLPKLTQTEMDAFWATLLIPICKNKTTI